MWRGLKIGDVLAHRYRILSEIGEGGMGRVFAAEDLKLGDKRWAVKEVKADQLGLEFGVREARQLFKLDHPQLPRIADFYHFEEINCTYLVMELVKGRTIQQMIEASGHLRFEETIRIGVQLCDILAYLHDMRPEPLIYRDLKPDNVMLDERGTVHLIDFGIARTYKADRPHDTVLFGNPAFLAPEQLQGRQSDTRTDLYQMGALLFYILSGGKCYKEASDLTQHLPELSADMRMLLHQTLSELPEDRPQTASEMKKTLLSLGRSAVDLPGLVEVAGNEAKAKPKPGRSGRLGYIVVGSLYQGAGATSTAFQLASALEQAGISCAIVEYAHHPEHVYRLGGEAKIPQSYEYLLDRGDHRNAADAESEWTAGSIVCYPMPPQAHGAGYSIEDWYRALAFIRAHAVVIDVGCHWHDAFVQDIVRRADYVACSVDSQPHKWYRKDVEQTVELMADLLLTRKNVSITAYQRERGHSTLWRQFPLPIAVKISALSANFEPLDVYAPLLKKWGLVIPAARSKNRLFKWLHASAGDRQGGVTDRIKI